MQSVRIAELLSPFLEAGDERDYAHTLLPQISTYIDILQRWNERINLTAIRDPEDIVTRHFGESFFAAKHLFPLPSVPSAVKNVGVELDGRLADVGSGAGFPGLPIKLWAPSMSMTLIESNHKKVAFLREVVRCLTLTNIDIQDARAETLPQASFQVVTLRAVEHFTEILPVAAALLAPLGRLALLIGSDQSKKLSALLPAHRLLDPTPIPKSRSRVLQLAIATNQTS
jgi:16S rRNA (guanine527-N7)-methyltransferase